MDVLVPAPVQNEPKISFRTGNDPKLSSDPERKNWFRRHFLSAKHFERTSNAFIKVLSISAASVDIWCLKQ